VGNSLGSAPQRLGCSRLSLRPARKVQTWRQHGRSRGSDAVSAAANGKAGRCVLHGVRSVTNIEPVAAAVVEICTSAPAALRCCCPARPEAAVVKVLACWRAAAAGAQLRRKRLEPSCWCAAAVRAGRLRSSCQCVCTCSTACFPFWARPNARTVRPCADSGMLCTQADCAESGTEQSAWVQLMLL
jgi:hypothetical protein